MRNLSPIYVADDEFRRHNLGNRLLSFNVPSEAADIAYDYTWTVESDIVCGERKSIDDFIASYTDERLHNQVRAMEGAWLKFILIEGTWSRDSVFVGTAKWTWEEFDNALLSIQCEGVQVVHSPNEEKTPSRLASLWRWTGKEEHGSWHSPVPVFPSNDTERGVIFYDELFRNHVGTLMHIPGVGMKTANDLRSKFSLAELLGITEEGITKAKEYWGSVKGVGPKTIKSFEKWVKS